MDLIGGVGLLSSLLANIPGGRGSIMMVKGYLVAAERGAGEALGPHFDDWPAATIPVFVAMMFGGTLGGNATLIGASANSSPPASAPRNGRRSRSLAGCATACRSPWPSSRWPHSTCSSSSVSRAERLASDWVPSTLPEPRAGTRDVTGR